MEDYKIKWEKSKELIRSNVGEERYRTWFANVEAVGLDGNDLMLRVGSRYHMEILDDQLYNVLITAVRHVFNRPIQLEYEYNVIANDSGSKVKIKSPEQSHILRNKLENTIAQRTAKDNNEKYLDPQLNTSLNFENYCVSKCNMLPYTIAKHIADHPEKPDFNPFFLYGNVGVGKTHLIQAIGIRIKEKNPRAKVVFVTMRQFSNQYSTAKINNTIPDFINWYMGMDVILFDDLQELSNKKGTVEVLFPIFNHLHQRNKKLIFTCDRPPMELDGIADRLIDRFKWGITEPLENPDFELRKKILTFKAAKGGLDLSEEIIDLIARSGTSSVRELEGIVMGLYTRSIADNSPITVALANEVISHIVKPVERRIINFDMIVESTAEFYKLNPDAIFSKSRLRDIADARQMIMYLCKKHTGLSSPAIGAKLNRKHATVLHGVSAIADRLDYSKELSDAVAAIEKSMNI